jgi:TPR repeat protein
LLAAEFWYREAAAQNHTGAIVMLAEALSASPLTRDNLAEIHGLWLAAASSGHAPAQRNVGVCYLEGLGCTADEVAGVRWLLAAAEQDDAVAEKLVGRCLQEGRGLPTDPERARAWLDRAAQHGLA